jgi:hypothetical protein
MNGKMKFIGCGYCAFAIGCEKKNRLRSEGKTTREIATKCKNYSIAAAVKTVADVNEKSKKQKRKKI